MTNTDKLQGQVRVSILVEVSQARADTYVHTHSMCDQCPLSGWTICVMQSGDPSFRPRIHSSTGWEALNSCIILSSQEIQAQGSCLPSFRAVSSSSPSFSERPFPKGFVQSTLTPTCEIPSLFVPSTFCAEDALQQPSDWFYKCYLEIQAEPLLSQMLGNLVLQVIPFFFFNPNFRITLLGSTEWGKKDEWRQSSLPRPQEKQAAFPGRHQLHNKQIINILSLK